MQQAANRAKASTGWNAIDWRKAQRTVNNLRRRIFRASAQGDHPRVRSLQKLMLRSHSNALLAVRRVTQKNRGRNTPGVDRIVVKTPKARAELVEALKLHQPWKVKPARRLYIPKANGKRRPLGIPTLRDRSVQAIVVNALEPEWEARFEGCSYGFRPGRGAHDAIEKIYRLARPNQRKTWILDADISGAFDTIAHKPLLERLGQFPARALIKAWLQAGYVEGGVCFPTDSGTPQGGVVSPLLANIALDGMEAALGIKHRPRRGTLLGKRALVRYADDLVVFCETREDAETAKAELSSWLAQRGLRLSEEKTRIVHLSEGFDFLGFNIRQYLAPKTSRSGWKLLIKPSKDAVMRIKRRLKMEWRALLGSDITTVLVRLNPIIRGWANYYRPCVAKQTFRKLDYWMYHRCIRYARRSHPRKPWGWICRRYWGKHNPRSCSAWYFGNKAAKANYLLKFADTKIERHIQVAGTASPDDPALRDYWALRRKRRNKSLPNRQRLLAERQEGLCPHCRGSLHNGEALHVHHRIARKDGGGDGLGNTSLVHLYCHQQIHRGGG